MLRLSQRSVTAWMGSRCAIELAAARIKLLPPQALLARLGHRRLMILTRWRRDVPGGSKHSATPSVELSPLRYPGAAALPTTLYLRWWVYLEAIEAVCTALGGKAEAVLVLEDVASLLDKSLLQQTELEGSEPRLVILETIREYGVECLADSGEREASQQAHVHYYLALAERRSRNLTAHRKSLG